MGKTMQMANCKNGFDLFMLLLNAIVSHKIPPKENKLNALPYKIYNNNKM